MKKKKILYFLSGLGIVAIVIISLIYRNLFGVSIRAEENNKVIYIPTGSSYDQVLDTLESNLIIKNLKVIDWVAKKKNYPELIKPGRYVIDRDLSYNGLINLLRSGRQSPVKIIFNNIRTLNQLAGKIGKQIEADSSQIINFLSDDSNFSSDGFKKEDIITLFIPNTYEFYWNTDVKRLYTRMLKEYRLFWNDQRLAKAKEKNLDLLEVAILASIIDDEVAKPDEKPLIAGVYLNRLKRGIPLQACPTIKFALNDFTITRVLKKHLLVDSPYNTYKHNGFPPGPIGCPTIEGIDAVLNAEKHDYLFFAAKADFSGYHNFSRTLSEHTHYAALYQKELDKRKIFK
ncbi:MAG: endolytic transglycosylase MltG [Bacteroidales bacterium]|nr:endolytic transglycosylase MltG [Bacteroidales bacterium]MDP3002699.1 endolytic transglycosylase MltG [Bacteroidales bacterium]